jgi:hypothetical protein
MKTSPDDTPSLPEMIEPSAIEITDQLPEAAMTFELFLKPPPEIRLMVWSFATLMRKVVLVRHRDLPLPRDGVWDSPAVVRQDLIPLLSVRQESRAAVLSTPSPTLLPVAEVSSYLLP